MTPMRTYDQFCPAARALDVVGDRWTLLIVRELLNRGGCRYTDLRFGLPGIATNLLADRLRELEANGIVTKQEAPPPTASTLFRLTPRGEALAPVLHALGRWGMTLLLDTPDDVFRSHWIKFPLEHELRDNAPARPPVTIDIRTADQPMILETIDGSVHVRPGSAAHADATVRGTPRVVLGLLMGGVDLASARAAGLEFDGDVEALRRIQPAALGGA
jgi:DNA-binding HxlR family transcriptional regulator